MTHVFVNFLLEVDDLLFWIVDEVTVAVKKVEIKDSTSAYYFPDIGIECNILY